MIHNGYHDGVWVAIIYPNDDCSPRWGKKGWWRLDPNQTKTVVSGDLSPHWMYYVHADDGGDTNWGDEIPAACPDAPFELCRVAPVGSPTYYFTGYLPKYPNLTINII